MLAESANSNSKRKIAIPTPTTPTLTSSTNCSSTTNVKIDELQADLHSEKQASKRLSLAITKEKTAWEAEKSALLTAVSSAQSGLAMTKEVGERAKAKRDELMGEVLRLRESFSGGRQAAKDAIERGQEVVEIREELDSLKKMVGEKERGEREREELFERMKREELGLAKEQVELAKKEANVKRGELEESAEELEKLKKEAVLAAKKSAVGSSKLKKMENELALAKAAIAKATAESDNELKSLKEELEESAEELLGATLEVEKLRKEAQLAAKKSSAVESNKLEKLDATSATTTTTTTTISTPNPYSDDLEEAKEELKLATSEVERLRAENKKGKAAVLAKSKELLASKQEITRLKAIAASSGGKLGAAATTDSPNPFSRDNSAAETPKATAKAAGAAAAIFGGKTNNPFNKAARFSLMADEKEKGDEEKEKEKEKEGRNVEDEKEAVDEEKEEEEEKKEKEKPTRVQPKRKGGVVGVTAAIKKTKKK